MSRNGLCSGPGSRSASRPASGHESPPAGREWTRPGRGYAGANQGRGRSEVGNRPDHPRSWQVERSASGRAMAQPVAPIRCGRTGRRGLSILGAPVDEPMDLRGIPPYRGGAYGAPSRMAVARQDDGQARAHLRRSAIVCGGRTGAGPSAAVSRSGPELAISDGDDKQGGGATSGRAPTLSRSFGAACHRALPSAPRAAGAAPGGAGFPSQAGPVGRAASDAGLRTGCWTCECMGCAFHPGAKPQRGQPSIAGRRAIPMVAPRAQRLLKAGGRAPRVVFVYWRRSRASRWRTSRRRRPRKPPHWLASRAASPSTAAVSGEPARLKALRRALRALIAIAIAGGAKLLLG